MEPVIVYILFFFAYPHGSNQPETYHANNLFDTYTQCESEKGDWINKWQAEMNLGSLKGYYQIKGVCVRFQDTEFQDFSQKKEQPKGDTEVKNPK